MSLSGGLWLHTQEGLKGIYECRLGRGAWEDFLEEVAQWWNQP